ncbi:hypothetical protein KP803_11370 [Vibrio sp. ZSDE26]|uniref:Uncharacterized protein n=1 Tax=Vibrio amylolyticus TaxID=2847292 RepID=A0A9X1XL23_9VIBR|nr:hypothetical protein [Vibrio amylolyticus]MCK6263868.1 hypothetical protein [Vibrio amylolyticus]
MNRSDIIIPIETYAEAADDACQQDMNAQTAEQPSTLLSKLGTAYRSERHKLEVTEIELNRSRIFMMDKNGNMKVVPLMSSH